MNDNDLTPKKGWHTSEFWISLAPLVLIVTKILGVDIGEDDVNNVLIAAGGAVAAVYALCRTLLKIFRIKNAGVLSAATEPQTEVQYVGSFNNPNPGAFTSGNVPHYEAAPEEGVEEVENPEDLK